MSESQDSRMAKIVSMNALEWLVLCCLLMGKRLFPVDYSSEIGQKDNKDEDIISFNGFILSVNWHWKWNKIGNYRPW